MRVSDEERDFFIFSVVILMLLCAIVACGKADDDLDKAEKTTTVVYRRYYPTSYQYFEYARQNGVKNQQDIVLASNSQERKLSESIYPLVKSVGYTFLGWYDNVGFIGVPVEKIPVGTIGTKRFYAKWGQE